MERFELAEDFHISRIIKGGWQLSKGHSKNLRGDPINDMVHFIQAGIDTFDCADIYTGVESMIGDLIRYSKGKDQPLPKIKVLTKYVPDYQSLLHLQKKDVEKVIDRSLMRLGMERLDMVQFAWWNYDVPRWVEVALWLQELQKAGKIHLLSCTNFNTLHCKEILSAGVSLTTSQVQYSLLDNRPTKYHVQFCEKYGIYLLPYGTLAGGFLSERWLNVKESNVKLENRSLVKYRLIIEEIGGWDLFQELLTLLKKIADKHNVGIANIAMRYILDQKQVAGIIVGARNATHIDKNLKTFEFALNQSDLNEIDAFLNECRDPEGDVFELERIKDGPHGRIMKYNLNEEIE